ncbi:MAG: PcfB family protein [Butyrivibrio sp.]|nr:PcfB family protein [Butyrivibrio sp.]
MNEEIAERTCQLAADTGKVTGRVLWSILREYLRQRAQKKAMPKEGKQTVKELVKQGQGATSMDVDGDSVGTFKRIANKYGVDFAIVKHKDVNPPKFTVFFKAKDMDAITAVVKDYTAKIVKQQNKEKPSVLKELKQIKDYIAKLPRKVKVKFKENVR